VGQAARQRGAVPAAAVRRGRRRGAGLLGLVLALTLSSGCSIFIDRATDRAADNLSAAILNHDDPETVRDGAPAYLLLMDSLAEGTPDADTLAAASSLYAAYAALFATEPERAARLSARSRGYADRALCVHAERTCGLGQDDFDTLVGRLEATRTSDLPVLYAYGVAWLVYIRAHSEDWTALADLPKTEALLERIVALDDTYENGNPHLFLGVLKTLRPPALGGEPDAAQAHFERAIEISGGRDLGMKVEYARSYARLVYDRELHDRLLNEALAADPRAPRLTLTNTLAQRDARMLLESADDYF
jgi:hypothetical protein